MGEDIDDENDGNHKAELIGGKGELILPDRRDNGPGGTVELAHTEQKHADGEDDQRLQSQERAGGHLGDGSGDLDGLQLGGLDGAGPLG